MKKIFLSNKPKFMARVIVPSLFSIAIFVWSVVQYIKSASLLLPFITILAFLLAFDNIVALSHPERIELDDEKIDLYAFGRKHTYYWSNIKRVSVRTAFYQNRIYLRLGKSEFVRGRYWIDGDLYNDGKELISLLSQKEAEIHPMLEKFSRRSANTRVK